MEPTASVRLDLHGELLRAIENWRAAHTKIPPRREAVFLILEEALKVPRTGVPAAEQHAA